MPQNNSCAVVIAGSTSSGKTELSLKLAKKFNGVIISADSRQVYKELDIATAKINDKDKQNIPHYMIDIVSVKNNFTVADYQKQVRKILLDIHKQNQELDKPIIPFIVGGTGLYIKSIVDNYQFKDSLPNKTLRGALEKLSMKELNNKLLMFNPDSTVDPKNRRRVIREIEVLKSLKAKSQYSPLPYSFLQIGIDVPRNILYKKINKKVEEMIKMGLIEETKELIIKKYNFDLSSLSTLGYKQIKDCLESKLSLQEAVLQMQKQTRNYAKRQLTWFKANPRIQWIKNYSKAEKLIRNFLD